MNKYSNTGIKRSLASILALTLAAYAIAQLAIALGLHETGLESLHHIGLVAIHSKSKNMANIFATHLLAQLGASPAYFLLIFRRLAPVFDSDAEHRFQKWMSFLFMTALASIVLFLPVTSVSGSVGRMRIVDGLVERSDLVFAGIVMAGLVLLSVGVTGLYSHTRRLWPGAWRS